MGRITGGRVSFKETRQIAQYEPRAVEIELSFSCDEGDNPDAVLNGIEVEVMQRVQRMLRARAVADLGHVEEATKPAAAPATETAEEPKKKAGRPPKQKPVVVEETAPPVEDDEGLDDVMGEEPAAEVATITDEDLVKKVTKHPCAPPTKDGGNPKAIKDLIAKFAGEGKKLAQVPQDKRAAFLAALAAMPAPEKLAA